LSTHLTTYLTNDYGFVLFLFSKNYDGQMTCLFCTLPPERIIDSNALGVVIRDGFPISPGHTLIIPKRHVGSFFEFEGRAELLTLLDRAKAVLDAEFKPHGYNIGISDGPAADRSSHSPHTALYQ